MTEKQIQTEILRTFATRPDIRLWRNNTGVAIPEATLRRYVGRPITEQLLASLPRLRFGVPGAADLTGLTHDGRSLWIEVKTPRGRQSKQQKAFETMVNNFNGIYILARSVGDVAEGLAQNGYGEPRQ